MDLCQQNLDGVKKVIANNKIITTETKEQKEEKEETF